MTCSRVFRNNSNNFNLNNCNLTINRKFLRHKKANKKKKINKNNINKIEMSEQFKKIKKSRVIHVDSEKSWDFIILQSKKLGLPVVVNFKAAWCLPSVAMNPFFEELALAKPCTLFLSVDIDEMMDLAKKLGVKAMPTFLMLRNGVIVDKLVGANPQEMLKRVANFVQSSPIVHIC